MLANLISDSDTIVAISTPPGRGGIGVVRVSGEQAREVTAPLLRLRHPLVAGRVRIGEIVGEDGQALDEAVVTWFRAPHSYTAEDVVEIACHGSPVLLEYLLRGCCARGARLAEAGEFTRRAFLSGRLDLTQAEAVDDLIRSSTMEQARLAARQLGGGLSRRVGPMKVLLVELIATLEAGIDFAEDDIEVMPQAEVMRRIDEVRAEVGGLAETFAYGRVLREGFTLAIVGRPNAGKSSLFNRLLERDRAIVTAMPGTTRDPVSERVSIEGVPVELVDTAGLREVPAGVEGEAESLGIARSRTWMAEADVVLVVRDASDVAAAGEKETLGGRTAIVVWNKCDLVAELPEGGLRTSALTGEGIAELRREIVARLRAPVGEPALVTTVRQHGALVRTMDALQAAGAGISQGMPHEMVLLDLYTALEALDSLTGVTTTEDVLGLIFSSFCIGK